MIARPRPDWEAPRGYVHVAEPDPAWYIDSTGARCRWTSRGERCPNEGVARLVRGRSGAWAYCAEHMYGRWIENHTVMHWIVVPEPARIPEET